MTIYITHDRLIKDVQEEFNGVFSFLKIEFFRKTYRFRPTKQKRHCLPSHLSFGKAYRNNKTVTLEIRPTMTVKELEKSCEEQLGLLIQVYRKSCNIWLETNVTNDWTIRQQNNLGGEISKPIK